MTTPERSADEIRREMAITRRRVRAEVGEVFDGARQLTDWRFYTRQFPWALVGGAAVVGYALIPRKLELPAPAVKPLERLLGRGNLPVEATSARTRKRQILGSLLGTTGWAIMKFGLAFAGREIGRRLQQSPVLRAQELTT
jgi:hypothetical protein